jgi:hypothetical protein
MQHGSALRAAHGPAFLQLIPMCPSPDVKAVALCSTSVVASALVDGTTRNATVPAGGDWAMTALESQGLTTTDSSMTFLRLAVFGNRRCRGLSRKCTCGRSCCSLEESLWLPQQLQLQPRVFLQQCLTRALRRARRVLRPFAHDTRRHAGA